jgi:hypothetical protein
MTAVQQVFSDLEKLQPHLFNMHSVEGREFVNHFHKYLDIEKQQMMQCYEEGYNSVVKLIEDATQRNFNL